MMNFDKIIFTLLLFSVSISYKNHSEFKKEYAQIDHVKSEVINQTESISDLWNSLVFEKGGCLGGEQYVKENTLHQEEKLLVFHELTWEKLSRNNKTELTDFLIDKFSDTTKTNIHTCPFFVATHGEMAVYALQHIHNKNWFDFPFFNEYKDKEYESANEQPQIWLRTILKDEMKRNKLERLFRNELKK